MRLIKDTVKVTFKVQGKEDEVREGPVSYNEFQTAEDVLTLLSDPENAKGIIDDLNYAQNMQARQKVRNAIKLQFEGPGKAINKAVKAFMDAMTALGKPMSQDQAIEQMKALGVYQG